jgi:anti-sigma factor RsiW
LEDALNLYVDGELAFEEQSDLFARLATDEAARRQLDAVMRFRRMSRLESISVPQAVDDAFFGRLARHRRVSGRFDRAQDRRPLWQARAPISVRLAMVAAMVVFLAGVLLPRNVSRPTLDGAVFGEDEVIQFADLDLFEHRSDAVLYVFYPGLTIEATEAEELIGTESM